MVGALIDSRVFPCSLVANIQWSGLLAFNRLCLSVMPVSPEIEQSLHRFVDAVKETVTVQSQLNEITDLEQLKTVVRSIDPVSYTHLRAHETS